MHNAECTKRSPVLLSKIMNYALSIMHWTLSIMH